MTLNLSGAYVGNWPNQQLKWSVCLAGFMFANDSTSHKWGLKELEALSPKMHFPKRMCSLIYKYYIFLVSQKVLICTVLTRTLGQIADLGTSGQTFGDSRKSTEPGR